MVSLTLSYKISLVVELEPGVWQKVKLSEPLNIDTYHKTRHIPSQTLGYSPTNLPAKETRYAIFVETSPWAAKTEVEEKSTVRVNTQFASPQDEEVFMQALAKYGISVNVFHAMAGSHQIDPWQAQHILETLEANERADILDIPITSTKECRVDHYDWQLAFGVRVGSQTRPDEMIPLSVHIENQLFPHGYEIMHSAAPIQVLQHNQVKKENARERLKILASLGVTQDVAWYLVVNTADIHTSQATEAIGANVQTKVVSRGLLMSPMSRADTLKVDTEDTVWTGNLVQIAPTIWVIHKEMDRQSTPEELSTLRDVLKHEADRKPIYEGNYQSAIRWNTPKIGAEIDRLRQETERLLKKLIQSGETGFSPGHHAGVLSTPKGIRFDPGGDTYKELTGLAPTYSAASTTFELPKPPQKAEVSRAIPVAGFLPINIRLVVVASPTS